MTTSEKFEATKTDHKWNSEFCSCGNDTVLCQMCGQIKCSSITEWRTPVPFKTFNGNVCIPCMSRVEAK